MRHNEKTGDTMENSETEEPYEKQGRWVRRQNRQTAWLGEEVRVSKSN